MEPVKTLSVAAASVALLAACGTDAKQSAAAGAMSATPAVEGQVVAAQTCSPCHGALLQGSLINTTRNPATVLTPSLKQARGYTWPEFNRLLTAGLTRDGRWVRDVMVTTRIINMPEVERRAVFGYLASYGMP